MQNAVQFEFRVFERLNYSNGLLIELMKLFRWWLHDPGGDEILTRAAENDLTLPLHGKIKFHPSKAGQFSTSYLLRSVDIFSL